MFKATLRTVFILFIYQTHLLGQYPTADQYISNYRSLAISEMKRTGIPASIKMAQALLESGAGMSSLCTKANNHFGIKCGNVWNGDSYGLRDDERMLLVFKKKSCFRKYNNAEESYIDHSEFIRRPNGPYQELFNLNKTDYKGWAFGLKKAGYATASDYPEKLIGIIERYHLYQLDGLNDADVIVSTSIKKSEATVLKTEISPKDRIIKINEVKAIVAKPGETPVSISRIANKDVDDILKYNDYLRYASQELNPNDIVFLGKKKKAFWGKNKTHTVLQGDNMFLISQLYGIRLDKLYERNHINPETEPAIGQTIYLRGERPDNSAVITSKVKVEPAKEVISKPVLVSNHQKSEPLIQKETTSPEFQKLNKRPVVNTGIEVKKSIPGNEVLSDKLDFVMEPAGKAKAENNDLEESHTFTPATTGLSVNKVTATAISPIEAREETDHEMPDKTKAEGTKLIPALTGAKAPAIILNTPAQKEAPIPNNTLYHTVTSGDTLYNISRRYNMDVESLKSLNQLTDNNIKLGQKLKIK